VLLGVAFATAAAAQDIPFQPDYLVAAGGSYSKYSSPPVAAGWLSAAVKVADKTYSITTLDMGSTSSSLRTGVARLLKQSGNWTLSLHGDGGVTMPNGALGGTTVALGSFSAGGMLLYDLGGLSKALAHVYAVGVVRILSINSTSVQPVFEVGIGKAF
jgi:hypothetical protein